MKNPDELLLFDDLLDDEPDDFLTLPEVRLELAHQHRADDLGIRRLWEVPEEGIRRRSHRVVKHPTIHL